MHPNTNRMKLIIPENVANFKRELNGTRQDFHGVGCRIRASGVLGSDAAAEDFRFPQIVYRRFQHRYLLGDFDAP